MQGAGVLPLLAALAVVQVVLVWVVPVLPGQDLPQHLAYVRILADYADPALPFREAFEVAGQPESYFTTYRLLAMLARTVGVEGAARVAYSLYSVGTLAAFAALARAVAPTSVAGVPWTAVLGTMVVWSPIAWMGFMPFLFGVPLVLGGYAAFVRATDAARPRSRAALPLAVAASAALASTHVIGALALAALVTMHAAALGRGWLRAGAVVGGVAATCAAWAAGAESGAHTREVARALLDGVRANGLDAVTWTLHVDWGTPTRKLEYAALALAGTLSTRPKLALAAGLALVLLAARPRGALARLLGNRELVDDPAAAGDARRAAGRAILGFAALCAVAPAAVQQPADVSFFDYRMIALACAVALAWIDGRAFEARGPRAVLLAHAAMATALFARAVLGVGSEGGDVRRLLTRLDARATLLAVPLHSSSAYVDPRNTVGHYWSMLHTVDNGGVTSQFWGRFSTQLPVAWRAGRSLPAPNNRRPWEVAAGHVRGASHVLVAYPPEDDDEVGRAAHALLDREADLLGCEGRSCLYRVRGRLSGPTH